MSPPRAKVKFLHYAGAMADETGTAAGASLYARLRRVAQAVLDLALPPLCLGCARPVGTSASLCPACWRGMEFIARPYCERLGMPFQTDLGPGILSLKAITEPPSFGRLRAAARYDGAARLLVHRLKYSDRLDLATAMGRWMVRAGQDVLGGADLLVPVPLHRIRFWGRRFNQAGELAKAIALDTDLPVAHEALRRVKATRSQVGLSAPQRARNLSGAFRLASEAAETVKGRRIVLVDDVMTTGATLNSAANVLRRAGAAEVDALVFALVAEPV